MVYLAGVGDAVDKVIEKMLLSQRSKSKGAVLLFQAVGDPLQVPVSGCLPQLRRRGMISRVADATIDG